MKTLTIALKDLRRSLTNMFFLAMGLGMPLLFTTIFYFAFGGAGSDDDGFDLPQTPVVVVDQDQPAAQYGNFSAGQLLVDFLQGDELSTLLQVSQMDDPAAARAAVDRQEAGAAVIIPPDLTSAVLEAEQRAVVEVYHDPALTLGPGIVSGIVRQFIDAFAGSKIAANVAHDQLVAAGVTVDAAMLQGIAMQYADWATAVGQAQAQGAGALLDVRSLAGIEAENGSDVGMVIGLISAGMLVFYVFFTGAASIQAAVLLEDEAGTLPRLFTTPTPISTILGGKFIAVLALVLVQIAVLIFVTTLVFQIDWGEPLSAALVTVSLALLSTSFGIFVTSLLTSSKQGGVIYGGVMTVAGMLAMFPIFTASVPNASSTVEVISLFVPQGWAVRAWTLLLEGGSLLDVLPTVAVMLALTVVFFVIGLLRFRKRFAR